MGDLALPARILKRLKLRRVGRIDYQLANGAIITMDQWLGKVLVGRHEYESFFLKGDWLLGMDFMQEVGQELTLDLVRGEVRLRIRR
jgi:hypothetical protein